MSRARAEVLARIRAALATPGGAPDRPVPPFERTYLGAADPWETDLPASDLAVLFADRIVDYRATLTRATGDEVGPVVARLLAGSARVVAPEGLDPTWLAAARAAGIDLLVDSRDRPVDLPTLDAVDAVVTASALAVAETGTIVLDSSPDQGRRAISLVPDHHVCVVRADALVRGLPAAMTRLDITRPLTWISGPSATSDIELSRVEGVHGPRRLDVVLVTG